MLTPPFHHRASFKKRHFSSRQKRQRHKLRNLLRPWGPCPYHLPPPGTEALGPPPPEPLYPPHPTGHPSKNVIFLLFVCVRNGPTKPQRSHFFGTAIQPLRPPQPSPATKALGLPPCPPGQLRWVPPPPRASFKKRHFSSFCTCLKTSKIRHKLRNLLRPWGPLPPTPCPYHLPPQKALGPPPEPQPRA